jgi:hypothetical protein
MAKGHLLLTQGGSGGVVTPADFGDLADLFDADIYGSILGGYTNTTLENYFFPFSNSNNASASGTTYKNPIACFIRNLTAYARATVAHNELIILNLINNTVATEVEAAARSGEPEGSYLGSGAWSRFARTEHIHAKRSVGGTNSTLFSGWAAEVLADQRATSFLGGVGIGTIAASTTLYYAVTTAGVSGHSNEARRQTPVPLDGLAHTLFFQTTTAQPASGSLVVTVFRNGAATGLTITIAAGEAAGYFHNTTGSFAALDGDTFDIEFKNNATGVSAAVQTYGFCLTATDGTAVFVGGMIASNSPANNFKPFFSDLAHSSTENVYAFPMPRPGILTRFSCIVPVGFEGNNRDTILRLRRAAYPGSTWTTALTLTVPEATSGRVLLAGSVAFNRGDAFVIQHDSQDQGGPPNATAEIAGWSARVDPPA